MNKKNTRVSLKKRSLDDTSRLWKILFFLYLGFYLCLSIYSVNTSGPIWDDEIEVIGLVDQISFAKKIFEEGLATNSDYEAAIATNLEFYGIINKIGGIVMYRLFKPVLVLTGLRDFEDELLGTVYINKFILIAFFCGMLCAVVKISHYVNLRNRYLPALLVISLPFVAGHSWLNIKDIPFGFFYTTFTLSILYVIRSRESRKISGELGTFNANGLKRLFPVLSGALAVGCRPAFLPIAILTIITGEICLWLANARTNGRSILFSVLISISGLILFSSALIPASWVAPFDYIYKAIQVHSKHPWGGCMLIFDNCRSIGTDYTTVAYLRDWLSVKLPTVHLALILAAGLTGVSMGLLVLVGSKIDFRRRLLINSETACLYLMVSLQAFLIPILAIYRNSNTYDGLRHWIFCVPAIMIITVGLLELGESAYKSISNAPVLFIKPVLTCLLVVGTILVAVDMSLISPYTYAYINEITRPYLNHTNIDLDYWGASSREIASEIRERKWKISNILDNGSAEHILYPRIYTDFGKFDNAFDTPNTAIVHKRFGTESPRLRDHECSDRFSIMRKLLWGKELEIAAVGLDCKKIT